MSEIQMCPSCDGSGYTEARMWLLVIVRILMRAGHHAAFPNGRIEHFPDEMEFLEYPPPAELEILTSALAGKKPWKHAGYDPKGDHQATLKIIRAAGLDPDQWGVCPVCQGEGRVESEA